MSSCSSGYLLGDVVAVCGRAGAHPYRRFCSSTGTIASPTPSPDSPPMVNERVQSLAPDLTKTSPRSPRASLGDYKVLAARALDKCRAELAGTAGSYHFNCPLDQVFFRFTGIDSEKFKSLFVSWFCIVVVFI